MRTAKWATETISDEDMYRWHAYAYAFRRVMLHNFDRISPLDQTGEWFDARLVDQAEVMWRAKLGRPGSERPLPPSSQDAIRTRCREIRAHHLTAAEHEFLGPEITEMAEAARHNVLAVLKRSNAAFREQRVPAQEIPPPRPRPAHVDIPPEELLASLERLSGGD